LGDCCGIHTGGKDEWMDGLVCFGTVGLGLLVVVFVGFLIDWFFTRYPLGWIDIDGSPFLLFFYSALLSFALLCSISIHLSTSNSYTTLYDIRCGDGGFGWRKEEEDRDGMGWDWKI